MISITPPTTRQVYSLHYGDARTSLVQVVRDTTHPNMWRMVWPDGRLSDLSNLTRVKDAAEVICANGPPERDPQRLRWRPDRSDGPREARTRARPPRPHSGPVARRWGYRAPESKPGKTAWEAHTHADISPRPNELLSVKAADDSYAVVGTESGAVVRDGLESVSEAAEWVDGFYVGTLRPKQRKGSRSAGAR
jgi:hypothetical protein